MLLIIEALLLILAALGQDHRNAVEGNIYPLDMAVNSVDDQYDDCTGEDADQVKTKYLKEEISASAKFSETWQEAEHNAKKAEDNLQQINSVAIYVYTNYDSIVYREFNNAVRSDKQKYKDKTFRWYSLHFLLTEAIQILKKTQKDCHLTYRGTTVEFDVLNKEVRFGSFTSSSLDRDVANGFGTKSCFEIETCEGADVIKYSKYPDQKEVLIPPYETFMVTDIKTKGQEGAWCDTVFMLKSLRKISYLNCGADTKLVQDGAKL